MASIKFVLLAGIPVALLLIVAGAISFVMLFGEGEGEQDTLDLDKEPDDIGMDDTDGKVYKNGDLMISNITMEPEVFDIGEDIVITAD